MPRCATSIEIGSVDRLNTEVAIIIERVSNGAIYVDKVTTSATGKVTLPVGTIIPKSFFDSRSQFYISVSAEFGYMCDDANLNITAKGGKVAKRFLVEFNKIEGDGLSSTAFIKA